MNVFHTMLHGLYLIASKQVLFDSKQKGRSLTPQYAIPSQFHVFRYAKKRSPAPTTARFQIQFQLKHLTAKQNERFSLLPMLFVVGFPGFYSKYWLVDETTNTCMGIYEWQCTEDAIRYSNSIAVRFMKRRSVTGSVQYAITPIESSLTP